MAGGFGLLSLVLLRLQKGSTSFEQVHYGYE